MAYQASPQSSVNWSSCVDRKLEKEKVSTNSSLLIGNTFEKWEKIMFDLCLSLRLVLGRSYKMGFRNKEKPERLSGNRKVSEYNLALGLGR